jgi:hypothetical protein
MRVSVWGTVAATPLVCPESTFSTERSFLERAAQLACCPISAVAGGARRAERTREVDDPQVTFLLSRGGKHDAAVGRAVPSGEAERVGQIVRRRLRRPVIRGRQRSSKVIRGHQRSSGQIVRRRLWGNGCYDQWGRGGGAQDDARLRRASARIRTRRRHARAWHCGEIGEIDGRSMGDRWGKRVSRRPGQRTVACSTRSKPESGTMPRACCGGSSAFW